MIYRSMYEGVIFEFTVPKEKQKGIVVLLNGMPSVPKLNDTLEALAMNGYVAIFPRYKGTWESSGSFLAQSPVLDIKLLCDEIIRSKKLTEFYSYKTFKLTTKNLILVGSSFGGAIALCMSVLPSMKKIIALSPVVNWKTYAGSETEHASQHMRRFVRQGFGNVYRFTDATWKNFETGKLFNPPQNLTKSIARKIVIVYDESDKTTLPGGIIDYAKNEHITLKKITGFGHLSFSKFPFKKLLELLEG